MNWALRLFAGTIDFLQLMVFVSFTALQFITPIGGAAAGGLAGAGYCWYSSSGVVSGALNAIWCGLGGAAGGAVLSTFAIPVGMAVNFAIGVVFGAALIIGIASAGKFNLGIILTSFIGETIPLINFLPFWSIMVHRCIAASKDQGASSSGMLSVAMGFVTAPAQGPIGLVATAAKVAKAGFEQKAAAAQQAPKERPSLMRFADITPPRAANDNAPQRYANVA